ncbi:MAG: PqiC family protein [Acidocella sp.]|nr:PqiC family protein [Acidocella sp.]
MSARRRAVLGGMLLAALTACASRVTDYYRLAMVAGASVSGKTGVITVRRISLPSYLDRNAINRPGGDYRFETFDHTEWAEPLGDMLQAIMVEDLAQRLPDATILASGSAIGTTPDMVVEIAVQRFDFDAAGRLALVGQIAIKAGPDRALVAQSGVRAAMAVGGADATASVAAMSVLWAQCADNVTRLIADG